MARCSRRHVLQLGRQTCTHSSSAKRQKKYVAIVGSPTAANPEFAYDDNYSKSDREHFPPWARPITAAKPELIVIAASTQGEEAALKTYHRLSTDTSICTNESAKYYRDYLARTRQRRPLPDAESAAGLRLVAHQHAFKALSTIPFSARDWSPAIALRARASGPASPGSSAAIPSGLRSRSTPPAISQPRAQRSNSSASSSATMATFRTRSRRAPTLSIGFTHYPYAYASADATPLYIISVNDYVSESGDVEFARDQWDQLWKAYQFLRSTYDAHGLPQTSASATAGSKAARCFPCTPSYYQSGLGARSPSRARESRPTRRQRRRRHATCSQAFEQQRAQVEDAFWLPDQKHLRLRARP